MKNRIVRWENNLRLQTVRRVSGNSKQTTEPDLLLPHEERVVG